MKIRFLLAILFSLILAQLGCKKNDSSNNSTPEVVYGSIFGTIYKSGTSVPVVSAIVEIGTFAATTDSVGYYIIKAIPVGQYTLKISRLDYLDYATTIQVTNGETKLDIKLVTTIPQIISGSVKNSLGKPVSGAKVSCAGKQTTTDDTGNYELTDIQEGNQTITFQADYYSDLNQSFVMPSGTKTLDFKMTSKVIDTVVSNLNFNDGSYSLTISWDELKMPTIAGYNIYYRKTFIWTQSDYDYIYNPNWTKINTSPIISSQYVHATEEYNVFYDYYVLPVNIDGVESPFLDGTTNILEVNAHINNQTLNSLDFGSLNQIGPFSIPTADSYLVLFIDWRYDLQTLPFAEWNLYLSIDNLSWSLINTFTTGDVFGGRRIWYIDLETFKGSSIYLKYDGEISGYLNIFRIIQFNK